MLERQYEHLPQAGDLEEASGTEIFYLAPRPVPTGTASVYSYNIHTQSNETFIDFVTGQAKFEFGLRGLIGSTMTLVIIFFACSLVISYVEIKNQHPITLAYIADTFANAYFWSFVALLVLLHSCLFWHAYCHRTKSFPIRFNRQRREVAYVTKRGQPPRFIPWEEVIACVSSGKVVTQYGVHHSFSLMIGLRDAESSGVLWITVPTASLMLAIAEWEAIRGYMEEGLSALPRPLSEECEEGTVAYFQTCRQVYRDNHGYVRYLLGFMLIQFCSGWTLPCHIAAWVERLPKTSFPKSVIEWSQPLPPDQWQKPSDALIEQSKAVRKSLRAGRSLFEHFRGDVNNRKAANA